LALLFGSSFCVVLLELLSILLLSRTVFNIVTSFIKGLPLSIKKLNSSYYHLDPHKIYIVKHIII
ncbi:MAG: hypothetical protein IJ848_03100, partial [Alphaproteobacteria bacterium]|nr:hypothetical protein [Alphaproteobacteria bacterium]